MCIIGNSSSGIRECSFLGIPSVNIGNRQANREKGPNVIDVTYDYKKIIKAIIKQINNKKFKKNTLYGNGNSVKKISKIMSKLPLTYEKVINYID